MKHTWISKIKKDMEKHCEPGLKAQMTVFPLYWNSTKWLLHPRNKTSWVLQAPIHWLPPGQHMANSHTWWKIVVRQVSHNSLHLNAEQHIQTQQIWMKTLKKAAVAPAVFLSTTPVRRQKYNGWDVSWSHCSSLMVLIEFKPKDTWNMKISC